MTVFNLWLIGRNFHIHEKSAVINFSLQSAILKKCTSKRVIPRWDHNSNDVEPSYRASPGSNLTIRTKPFSKMVFYLSSWTQHNRIDMCWAWNGHAMFKLGRQAMSNKQVGLGHTFFSHVNPELRIGAFLMLGMAKYASPQFIRWVGSSKTYFACLYHF